MNNEISQSTTVSESKFKTDIATHGLSHDHWFLKFKGAAELYDEFGIEAGGQLVFIFLKVPACWWQRFAVSRNIEHYGSEIRANVGIA